MSAGKDPRAISFPRVLLVGPRPVPPVTGGVEKGIDMLLRTDLARRAEMRLFNNYRRRDPRRSLHERVRYQLGMVRSFRRAVRDHAADLVHIKTSSGLNFLQNSLYAQAARLSGKPVLLQIHGGKVEIFYRESHALLRVWIRHTLSRADRVAVLSRRWAERIRGIAPRARVVVIPNGLEATELAALKPSGPKRPGRVVFIGAGDQEIDIEKGLQDLLDVMPQLATRYPDSTWTLAGLNDPHGARDRFASAAGSATPILGRVSFLSSVTAEERVSLFRDGSILVLPSHYENMPNVLLEAMAAGMGVVASNVGAIPEMLEAPEGGLVYEPRDRDGLARALDRLLSSAPLVREQGLRNLATVTREFTMSLVEREMETLYLEVAAQWRARRPIGRSVAERGYEARSFNPPAP